MRPSLRYLAAGPRHALAAAVLAALAALAGRGGAGAGPKEVVLMERRAFEEGLKGWAQRGAAEFALDAGESHEGLASARLTVAPGTAPEYQQLRREFYQDMREGDELRASAWVRTRGVDAGPGAYLALEFVDAADQRVGIAHSKSGAGNGARGWERLEVAGTAPAGTAAARLCLVLHAHGTAWFAAPEVARTGRREAWPGLGDAVREVRIHAGEVVHPRFGGVGFHAFHHSFPTTQVERDTVIYKRWRELSPSFARLNDSWDWDRAKWDDVATHVLEMKRTGTELYLATWNPKDTPEGEERAAYARRVVDNLEYLIRQKGATNLHYYCLTNELSLGGWGKLAEDLPKFRSYHQALYEAIKARGLDVGLLATDASPLEWWGTIEWATQNMDDITAVYGGHHYIADRAPDDERFYPWFLSKMEWGVGLARAKGKSFILGEFGSTQDGRTVNGVKLDRCVYFDTPMEPLVPIQLAEAVIAAINAGAYSMGYWTFMDCPDEGFGKTYQNKWGLFRCSGEDRSTRPLYYGYGLLSKFLRGPATVLHVQCSDPRVRVAAIQHHGKETWSVAVVNRNKQDVPLALTLDGKPVAAAFRKYVYDPVHVPQHPFGDLQGPAGKVAMKDGRLRDTVGAGTLTVYTTAYDDRAPAAVRGLKVERPAGGIDRLTWRANTEPDLCYYRVYRGTSPAFVPAVTNQVGSTIATEFAAPAAPGERYHYKVVAVDQSGNAGRHQ